MSIKKYHLSLLLGVADERQMKVYVTGFAAGGDGCILGRGARVSYFCWGKHFENNMTSCKLILRSL